MFLALSRVWSGEPSSSPAWRAFEQQLQQLTAAKGWHGLWRNRLRRLQMRTSRNHQRGGAARQQLAFAPTPPRFTDGIVDVKLPAEVADESSVKQESDAEQLRTPARPLPLTPLEKLRPGAHSGELDATHWVVENVSLSHGGDDFSAREATLRP